MAHTCGSLGKTFVFSSLPDFPLSSFFTHPILAIISEIITEEIDRSCGIVNILPVCVYAYRPANI